jgi:glycosyltransferase involved in cell wall biosynthesis
MKEVLLARAVEKDQINLIYNYSARTIQRANKLKMKAVFGWSESDFIVLHTGNIGNKQNLENLVLAASLLEESSNIKIFLVGHGNQESKIRNMCFGKSNIFVIPSVSDSKYSQLLSAADLLIINERITQLDMSLPSKLTSYFYSERPVIAAVPRGGATWKFLDGIAELVEAGKPSLLADAIKALSQDPVKRKDLASKGLKFARKNLDAEIGRTKYLDWVNSLIQSKRG